MEKKNKIQDIKSKKEVILQKLAGYYEKIFKLNCEETQLEYSFPENYQVRKFTVENVNGKVLTFGKINLKKMNSYECEIWAYQLKRNGTYYTNSEPVTKELLSKINWLEIE
ncbi:MAG: hypothetical protein ACRC6U_04985 [Fusobacteriaceae bacterium]